MHPYCIPGLKNMGQNPFHVKVTKELVINTVSEYFNMSFEEISMPINKQKHVYPRHICISMLYEFTLLGVKEIGEIFPSVRRSVKKREHSIVSYAKKRVKEYEQYNSLCAYDIMEIRKRIREGGHITTIKDLDNEQNRAHLDRDRVKVS